MFARPAAPAPRPRLLSRWLFLIAFLVWLMVIVGGITRLTESGLSIVKWEPVAGAIPPLNQEDWQHAFDEYRQSPQYERVNRGMTLDDFKSIYFWEFVHRLLGRLIGVLFALPLAWFAWRRAIPPGYTWKLVGILCLGALQGAVGWWMVASGLVDNPHVSHVRLAIHLLMALAIFSTSLWVAMDFAGLARDPTAGPARLPSVGIWTLCVLALQLMYGAYTAGLQAGFAFNTWPLMGDSLFPRDAPMMEPFVRNLVDNPIVVQFIHRWLAWVVALMVAVLAAVAWHRRERAAAQLVVLAVIFQIMLGITTLIRGVPIETAVAHQGMAVLLLGCVLFTSHRLGAPHRAMTDAAGIVTVYATFPDAAEAERVARIVVEERLAACANLLAPCRSIYRWQGAVETAEEVPALFKTSADTAEALIARIAALHSYDVPAAVVWTIEAAHPPYAEWVRTEATQADERPS